MCQTQAHGFLFFDFLLDISKKMWYCVCLPKEASTVSSKKIKEIGKRIRRIRKVNKITQEQLAEMIDVSVPYISKIENGKTTASADIIVRLTQALHTSADAILCLEKEDGKTDYADVFSKLIKQCTAEEANQILEIIRIIMKIIENKYD